MLMNTYFQTFLHEVNKYIPNCTLKNKLGFYNLPIFPLVEALEVEPIENIPYYELFKPKGYKCKPTYEVYKPGFRIQKYKVQPQFKLILPFDTMFCQIDIKLAIYIHKNNNNYYGCFIYSRLTNNNRFMIYGIDVFMLEQKEKNIILTTIIPETLYKAKPVKLPIRFNVTLKYLALFANKCMKLNQKRNNIYVKLPEKGVGDSIVTLNPVIVYTEVEDPNVVYSNIYNPLNHRHGSWFRRGHWRKLQDAEKIGKDENGNYIVPGYTWVKNHICGDGKLVNKPYIIK